MNPKHLVVIGGGAAGFFCAVTAARLNPGLKVSILEKSSRLLSKVRISGGGRCNVTHALFTIDELVRRYPRGKNFIKKTFHQFFTTDTIKWFEERGVSLKAERDGRMFPVTDSSQTIIDCLMKEANKYKVEIRLNTEVKDLERKSGQWQLSFANGHTMPADFICVAAGGYPKATMFDWLRKLGHSVSEPVPSLFTLNLPGHPITQLMGVSVEQARVKIGNTKLVEEGPVLITHWGLSGPAVLRLSAWGARDLKDLGYDFNVHINWLPEYTDASMREAFSGFRKANPVKKVSNHNFGSLPERLWLFLLQQSGISTDLRFCDLPAKAENSLIKNLVDFVAAVRGKTTFKEEFVTAGGITLTEVDAATLMSRKVPNLFFAGEVLDIDGITGGFNFQNAWTTGYIAGKTISEME
ncbi:MAG TPA: NAD(P)/FAD-dependent oxidoreductase [Flavisolibacter sp.]